MIALSLLVNWFEFLKKEICIHYLMRSKLIEKSFFFFFGLLDWSR